MHQYQTKVMLYLISILREQGKIEQQQNCSRGQNCTKDQFLTSDNFARQRVRGNSDIKKKN